MWTMRRKEDSFKKQTRKFLSWVEWKLYHAAWCDWSREQKKDLDQIPKVGRLRYTELWKVEKHKFSIEITE